jgi:hypothetical protein
MRAFRTCGTVLTLLVASGLSFQAARADELLVIPYSCKVVGGHPVLTPSENQAHPVIGRREQQEFRACSPADPQLCRRWNVHRFTVDCGGVRVPWVDLVAAAERDQEGGAIATDGYLEIEMPARWSLPPDAPCARQGGFNGAGFRREFCAERLARFPRVTVTMPWGFAPMLGIDGIFVADTSGRGAVAEATPRPEAVPDPVANPMRRKPAQEPAPVKTVPEKETAVAQALPPPQPEKASPTKTEAPPGPDKSDPAAADSATAAASPIIPQIINGANAVQPAHEPDGFGATGALPDRPASPSNVDKTTTHSEVAGSSAAAPEPERLALADREDGTSLVPIAASGGPLVANATVITIGTLAVLSLLTLAFVLRRGRAAAVPALSRDISSVSLGKSGLDGQRPSSSALAIVPEPLTGRDLAAPPVLSSSSSLPMPLGDAMPRTRAEALEVLGMGLAPDINEAAIKKIIDGLRMSWHPDHARDDVDRATRELRLKQINAAWDIISGPRPS